MRRSFPDLGVSDDRLHNAFIIILLDSRSRSSFGTLAPSSEIASRREWSVTNKLKKLTSLP